LQRAIMLKGSSDFVMCLQFLKMYVVEMKSHAKNPELCCQGQENLARAPPRARASFG
jgi:hypothetical protein